MPSAERVADAARQLLDVLSGLRVPPARPRRGRAEGEIARWLVGGARRSPRTTRWSRSQTDKTTVEIPSPAAGPVSDPRRGGRGRAGRHRARRDRRRRRRARAAAAAVPAPDASARRPRRCKSARRRSSGGSPRSSASTSTPLTAPARRAGSPRRTCAGRRRRDAGGRPGGRREPLRGVRRGSPSSCRAPTARCRAVTVGRGVRLRRTADLRARSLPALTLRAVAASLREYPELNARLDGDEIVYLDRSTSASRCRPSTGSSCPSCRGCADATRRRARRRGRAPRRAAPATAR